MAPKPRLALLPLLLALSASAADYTSKIPAAPPIRFVSLATVPQLPQQAATGIAAPTLVTSGLPADISGGIAQTLVRQSEQVAQAIAADPSGLSGKTGLDTVFSGGRSKQDGSVRGNHAPSSASSFIKNDEGVWVGGRVASQYREIRRLHDLLAPHMDLSGTMNVMDDAFDEARVKLAGVEKAAANRKILESSVHLQETRTWVDAILVDQTNHKVIAEHTHRVYFHPADNPASEISEGNRRVDSYLEKAKMFFSRGGKAEGDLRTHFDEVILTFDTRGYKEIEDHLRRKEAALRLEFGDRFTFNYVTQPPLSTAKMRAEYNRLVEKYKSQPHGLMNIIDGVTYSRYVGLLHELKSHEYSLNKGETVLQAGRDFFEDIPQPDGSKKRRYITEFDGVVRTRAGTIILREDKSVRVPLPLADVMQDTFLYKLDIYKKNRALIERDLGAPLNVRFTVDVGGLNRRAARQGRLVWDDPGQRDLMLYLKRQGPILSAQYGFPVYFIFINSHPGEDPMLFYKKPSNG